MSTPQLPYRLFWVPILATAKLHQPHARGITSVLRHLFGGREYPVNPQVTDQADRLAAELWGVANAEGAPNDSDDWYVTAINHAAGNLVLFWISRLASLGGKGASSTAAMDRCRSCLSDIVRDHSVAGRLGRSVLASGLSDLLSADAAWTKNNLLPRFCDHHIREDYQALWDGLLYGLIDQRVANLLQEPFLDAVTRIDDQLAGLRRRRAFIKRYVQLLVHYDVDAVDAWIPPLLPRLGEDERVVFAQQIRQHLEAIDQSNQTTLWNRWLKRYWCNRLQGVPVPLAPRETWCMLRWLPVLRAVFREAVAVAIRMPTDVQPDPAGDLTVLLVETDLPTSCPLATAKLLLYLGRCPHYHGWCQGTQLMEILLRSDFSPPLKVALQELSARHDLRAAR